MGENPIFPHTPLRATAITNPRADPRRMIGYEARRETIPPTTSKERAIDTNGRRTIIDGNVKNVR